MNNIKYNDEVINKYGNTKEYQEFKNKNITNYDEISKDLMDIFKEIGSLIHLSPSDKLVQDKINYLKDFISNHFYTCSNDILYSLGLMYINDERFKNNIDNYSGNGTSEFVYQAIKVYCNK